MIKNVIIYRDSFDIENVLPFSEEVSDIDLEGMIGFTRVNLESESNDYLSMTDTYVVGIPYRYNGLTSFLDKEQLRTTVLNHGQIVSEDEANYCFEFKTGNVFCKASNIHIVSNQNELLRNFRKFIEENKQIIGTGTQHKSLNKVRK